MVSCLFSNGSRCLTQHSFHGTRPFLHDRLYFPFWDVQTTAWCNEVLPRSTSCSFCHFTMLGLSALSDSKGSLLQNHLLVTFRGGSPKDGSFYERVVLPPGREFWSNSHIHLIWNDCPVEWSLSTLCYTLTLFPFLTMKCSSHENLTPFIHKQSLFVLVFVENGSPKSPVIGNYTNKMSWLSHWCSLGQSLKCSNIHKICSQKQIILDQPIRGWQNGDGRPHFLLGICDERWSTSCRLLQSDCALQRSV